MCRKGLMMSRYAIFLFLRFDSLFFARYAVCSLLRVLPVTFYL